VTGTGKARAGFSLMEILMAVGILGVGMTMVASVFPVAVDQSRRSRDLTMAALSARSVAAALRARRQEVVNALRDANTESAWGTFEDGADAKTPRTARLDSDQTPTGSQAGLLPPLPRELRSYNPRGFLYDDSADGGGTKSARQYSANLEGIDGLWSAGSYVPVVFATPISNDPNDNETNKAGHGPWRITIMIYKSRGQQPDYLNQNPSSSWVWNQRKASAKNPGGAGSYVMDWRFSGGSQQMNNRGEAYKVQRHVPLTTRQDAVVPAVAFKKAPGARPGFPFFNAFVAGGDQSKGTDCYSLTNSIPSEWVSLPGAIAAYHTILGD